MSWITVVWSMNAAACLTLAAFYGAVWSKQRKNYRIAQEAVRNAIEHGGACQVLIQLTFGDRNMMLMVQGDGQAFHTKSNGHGMGLRIMRYRAQCIGGSCEVHAGPTQGTLVHCRVPLEAQPSLSTIS